jgi:hypothetical protein
MIQTMELVFLHDLPIHCEKYHMELLPEHIEPDFSLQSSAMHRGKITCSFTILQCYKSYALIKQDSLIH